MSKTHFKFLLFILLLIVSCKEEEGKIPIETFTNETTFEGWVVGISDGDSFKIKLENNEIFRVRLAYVDCPERGQDFYQKAKNFSSSQIFKKSVRIKAKDTDRYGRTVGLVFYDGKILNEELLRNGFAWHYAYYSKDKKLQQLENQARAKKIGIWSQKKPIPPWEYRRNREK